MKPVKLFKKLGAALSAGLLALGIIAGAASSASADVVANGGNAGELSSAQPDGATALGIANAGELS
ncbi:hypothetical protein [Glycomyces tritici]|uniref:Secreted protein n=1 Tax=Glycomyces tritici TaxID=2665176 RepID=A0ABT7YW57_9ACTN|nr:hypothetical protein [Glycomyces tritici]MDN3240940.1 hypothetical protein [Glycomyces tritici]MDN3242857.1 hypothetical protein [Glycomyces tritici]